MNRRPSVRRAAQFTFLVAVLGAVGMGIAQAHQPHRQALTIEWHPWHLKGKVFRVVHVDGDNTDTFKSHAKSWYGHTHTFFAKIEWLDQHCSYGSFGCWWDTHGVWPVTRTGTYAETEDLEFTATICRRYKYIGGHRNDSHESGELPIDQEQGVVPFRAPIGCLGESTGVPLEDPLDVIPLPDYPETEIYLDDDND